MVELKTLTPEAIPRALEKAERYRLLNEPQEAESICEDVLQIEPDHQEALVMLLLALTEQFDEGLGDRVHAAQELVPRLRGKYEQAYYAGIILERQGKARLHGGGPGAAVMARDCAREAMVYYEKAESLRPAGNDDALLRWNACARLLMRMANVSEAPEPFEPMLE
jgi:tetratricopeptide (TPR) repeat protein